MRSRGTPGLGIAMPPSLLYLLLTSPPTGSSASKTIIALDTRHVALCTSSRTRPEIFAVVESTLPRLSGMTATIVMPMIGSALALASACAAT
jgi:hypothetical protein